MTKPQSEEEKIPTVDSFAMVQNCMGDEMDIWTEGTPEQKLLLRELVLHRRNVNGIIRVEASELARRTSIDSDVTAASLQALVDCEKIVWEGPVVILIDWRYWKGGKTSPRDDLGRLRITKGIAKQAIKTWRSLPKRIQTAYLETCGLDRVEDFQHIIDAKTNQGGQNKKTPHKEPKANLKQTQSELEANLKQTKSELEATIREEDSALALDSPLEEEEIGNGPTTTVVKTTDSQSPELEDDSVDLSAVGGVDIDTVAYWVFAGWRTIIDGKAKPKAKLPSSKVAKQHVRDLAIWHLSEAKRKGDKTPENLRQQIQMEIWLTMQAAYSKQKEMAKDEFYQDPSLKWGNVNNEEFLNSYRSAYQKASGGIGDNYAYAPGEMQQAARKWSKENFPIPKAKEATPTGRARPNRIRPESPVRDGDGVNDPDRVTTPKSEDVALAGESDEKRKRRERGEKLAGKSR